MDGGSNSEDTWTLSRRVYSMRRYEWTTNPGEHQKPQGQAEGKGHWRKTEVTGAQGDPGEQVL